MLLSLVEYGGCWPTKGGDGGLIETIDQMPQCRMCVRGGCRFYGGLKGLQSGVWKSPQIS